MDLRKMTRISVLQRNKDIIISLVIMILGFIIVHAFENGMLDTDALRNPLGVLWQSVQTLFQ
jgi:hypothetical protein